jgi:alpha-1,6-mannosyltransferase
MRIVRLANFVMPRSGGLRTALRCLGEGYLAAGHEPVMIVPGPEMSDEMTPHGRVITLPGPEVPGSGGYRLLITGRRRLTKLLDHLDPDRIEVSDRSTLRWTGRWARDRGVPSMMVSHESLAGLLTVWGVPESIRVGFADLANKRTARAYDKVVCTTAWAAAEFRRLGVDNLVEVPLGVDLETFHPSRRDHDVRSRYAADGEVLLVHCSRLSGEKHPEIAVDTLAVLRAAGVPAVLVVVGDGPRREALEQRAAGLPVRFLGFVADRSDVADLLACADVVVAPGPVETFGLAALESLACGSPVVVNAASALPEVVGPAGVAAAGTGAAFAEAVLRLLDRPESGRREAARARAEQFSWPAAVAGFLRAHGVPPAGEVSAASKVPGPPASGAGAAGRAPAGSAVC